MGGDNGSTFHLTWDLLASHTFLRPRKVLPPFTFYGFYEDLPWAGSFYGRWDFFSTMGTTSSFTCSSSIGIWAGISFLFLKLNVSSDISIFHAEYNFRVPLQVSNVDLEPRFFFPQLLFSLHSKVPLDLAILGIGTFNFKCPFLFLRFSLSGLFL